MHDSAFFVPHVIRRPSQVVWCSYRRDKQIFLLAQSSTWTGSWERASSCVLKELMLEGFQVTHTFLWGHRRMVQHSMNKMGVSILAKWAESTRGKRSSQFVQYSGITFIQDRKQKSQWRLNCCLSVFVMRLTVGSSPDGDSGRLSRSLFRQSAHRENILLVLL